MKYLKIIGGIVITLIVGFVAVGFLLPSSAKVQRSIHIQATPCQVYDLVDGVKRFNEYSPWAKLDPQGTKYSLEGPEHGVGAKLSWSSAHPNVGNGSMEVMAVEKCERVETKLDFGPNGTANAWWTFAPSTQIPNGTLVYWGFESPFGYNIIGRYFGLMMDSMIGPDYEAGLAGLKKLAESESQPMTIPPVDVAPPATPTEAPAAP